MSNRTKPICFLVTPIGPNGGPERNRADQWKKFVYKPVLGNRYRIVRADEVTSPGHITDQIIDYLIDADLVIIDYTGLNANVMYEAAIRHMSKKPFIHIASVNDLIPFDVKTLRMLCYDPLDLNLSKKMKKALKEAIKEVEAPGYRVPEILKYQFDLDRITADPEKFVEILKQKLLPAVSSKRKKGIVKIDSSWNYRKYSWDMSTSNQIKCPSCGVVSEGARDPYNLNKLTIKSSFSIYKCENCGTEFQA